MSRETPTDVLIRAMSDIDGVEDAIVIFRETQGAEPMISSYSNRIEIATAQRMLATTLSQMLEDDNEGAD